MEKKTVPELKQIAKNLGISGYSKWKKEELLRNIQAFTGPAPVAVAPVDVAPVAPLPAPVLSSVPVAKRVSPKVAQAKVIPLKTLNIPITMDYDPIAYFYDEISKPYDSEFMIERYNDLNKNGYLEILKLYQIPTEWFKEFKAMDKKTLFRWVQKLIRKEAVLPPNQPLVLSSSPAKERRDLGMLSVVPDEIILREIYDRLPPKAKARFSQASKQIREIVDYQPAKVEQEASRLSEYFEDLVQVAPKDVKLFSLPPIVPKYLLDLISLDENIKSRILVKERQDTILSLLKKNKKLTKDPKFVKVKRKGIDVELANITPKMYDDLSDRILRLEKRILQ